ncbi:hydrogenase maturation protease [bacterium]|nr:hydrogenase maturation protease [bacterium]
MARALIIGYGNTLRGDDGVGRIVAETLQQRLADREHVQVLSVHQLTPELAADLAEAGRVLFIDASSEGEPGDIRLLPLPAPDPSDATPGRPLGMGHSLSPLDLLSLSLSLYGQEPRADLLTVSAREFGHEEILSGAVRAVLQIIIQQAIEWCDKAVDP